MSKAYYEVDSWADRWGSSLRDTVFGTSSSSADSSTDPDQVAQTKTDAAQDKTNVLLARRKRKSSLSTGASSVDLGSIGQAKAFKTLLGG